MRRPTPRITCRGMKINMKKKSYSRSSATDCSTLKPFSYEWWKMIEANRIEKAYKFGPGADVLSTVSARAMVIDALKWFKLKA